MNNIDRTFEIVRKRGTCLPVEAAKELGLDSMTTNVYLTHLCDIGKIKKTKPVGGAFLYFMPGQEMIAEARARAILEQAKKTARMFARQQIQQGPETARKQEAFMQRLKEIEEREKRVPVKKAEPQYNFVEKLRQAIVPVLSKAEAKPEASKSSPEPADSKLTNAQVQSQFNQKSKNILAQANIFLNSINAEVLNQQTLKKGKEAEIVVNIPSHIGKLKMLVKIKDKKILNEGDLSLAYTEGVNKKMPVLFLTNGKLTKTAQNYLNVIGGLVKVKVLNGD